jgi:hypothetical protein
MWWGIAIGFALGQVSLFCVLALGSHLKRCSALLPR